MTKHDELDIDQFLVDYPAMSLRPITGDGFYLTGTFRFCADHPDHGLVTDAFDLRIDVPRAFPRDLPQVWEIGDRIPRDNAHHVNRGGSLCLGSPLSLLEVINRNPTLPYFADKCLTPWLYAMSIKLAGGNFVFGELAHNGEGLLNDYVQLFRLQTPVQARLALELLTIKRRVANKRGCPCGCSRRLGRCRLRLRLLHFRRLAGRRWFRSQLVLADS